MLQNICVKYSPSALLALALCLSGCVDRSGIQSQAEPLAEKALSPLTAHHAPWPSAKWWQSYQDPQLDAWIDRALQGSPSLKVAQARVRKAYALAGMSKAPQGLQGNVSGSISRKKWPDDHFYGPGDLASTDSWNNQIGSSFSYNLDLWGKLESQSLKALDEVGMSQAQAQAARLELQGNIVQSYVQLAEHYAALALTEDEIKHREQLIALAKQRLQLGVGTQLDVSQASLAMPALERQKDLYSEAITLTKNRLALLAGVSMQDAQQLKAPKLSPAAHAGLPSDLPLRLVARRPDVQASIWQVKAASRSIDVAVADFYPDINLVADIGALATQGSLLGFLTHKKMTASVGPALTLPWFDGGLRRDALGAANAEYDVAVETYNQTLLNSVTEIADQLTRLHSIKEQQEFIGNALSIAERNLELSRLRYSKGLSAYQSVVEAETEIFAQKHLLLRLDSELLAAQAHLSVALGGGQNDQQSIVPHPSEAKE